MRNTTRTIILSIIFVSLLSFSYEYFSETNSFIENQRIYVHKSQTHSQVQFLVTFCFIMSFVSLFIKSKKISQYLYLISLILVPLLYLILFFNYYKTNYSLENPYPITTLISNSFGFLNIFFLLISLGLILHFLISKKKVLQN